MKKAFVQKVLVSVMSLMSINAFAAGGQVGSANGGSNFYDIPHPNGIGRLVCARESQGMVAVDLKNRSLTKSVTSMLSGTKIKKLATLVNFIQKDANTFVATTSKSEVITFVLEDFARSKSAEGETYLVDVRSNRDLQDEELELLLLSGECSFTVIYKK